MASPRSSALGRILPGLLLLIASACHGGDGDEEGSHRAGGATGTGATGTGATGTGATGTGATGTGGAGGNQGTLGGPFRFGINLGHRNAAWSDPETAELAAGVHCNSIRLSLPERHLDRWGYDIELADVAKYSSLGMTGHVAFLRAPIAAHSTAPSGTEEWKLAYYIPKHLYEPILLADGTINPDNYWAKYVFETVKRYHPTVKVWEVWNEPDWVSDWKVTQAWTTRAPTAADLPRFNGSVYDYVRMLRVTRVAARLADPQALVATGGLGYPSFLAAVVRSTDNPEDGSVSAEYPEAGGAYFDVVSFHYYPIYTPGDSDAAVDGYLKLQQDFAAVLADAKLSGKGWVTTETAAPHDVIPATPSGAEYARNYLLKVMTLAPVAGVGDVDWYALSDSDDPPPDTSDPYEHMGLYGDIASLSTPSAATKTESGVAYATIAGLLAGARYDAGASAALALPSSVRGAVFAHDGGRATVLWARATGDEAAASVNYSFATDAPVEVQAWDSSRTGAKQSLTPTSGHVALTLTPAPVIVVRAP